MWSLVLYVVAAGSTLHMNAMDGMDGQTDDQAQLNSRQLSRDDQGVAQDHLKYTGCDSNFRGGRQYSCPDASFPICGSPMAAVVKEERCVCIGQRRRQLPVAVRDGASQNCLRARGATTEASRDLS